MRAHTHTYTPNTTLCCSDRNSWNIKDEEWVWSFGSLFIWFLSISFWQSRSNYCEIHQGLACLFSCDTNSLRCVSACVCVFYTCLIQLSWTTLVLFPFQYISFGQNSKADQTSLELIHNSGQNQQKQACRLLTFLLLLVFFCQLHWNPPLWQFCFSEFCFSTDEFMTTYLYCFDTFINKWPRMKRMTPHISTKKQTDH